jgi:hypothetical protein
MSRKRCRQDRCLVFFFFNPPLYSIRIYLVVMRVSLTVVIQLRLGREREEHAAEEERQLRKHQRGSYKNNTK